MTQTKKTVGEEEQLINSNGTLYIAGWDEQGWFSITHVEEDPEEEDVYWTVGEYPSVNVTDEGAEVLRSLIEDT